MPNPKPPAGTDYFRQFFLWTLIVVLLWGYMNALWHIPRAQHWSFLMETLDCETFAENWSKSWSLDRTREITPQNPRLFRPFFYGALSLEKALFGHHTEYFQGLNITLHFLICWLMFSLLRSPRFISRSAVSTKVQLVWRNSIAFMIPIFFAINVNVSEMVIGSYGLGHLSCLVLLLLALYLLVRDSKVRIGRAMICLFAACLFSEYGHIYALIFGFLCAILHYSQKRDASALITFGLFVGIAIAYQTMNQFDAQKHASAYSGNQRTLFTREGLGKSLEAVKFTAIAPFFPEKPQGGVEEDGRLETAKASHATFFADHGLAIPGAALFAGLSMWGLVLAFVRGDSPRRALLFSLVAMLLVYWSSIVYADMVDVDRPLLNAEHAYWPLLLILLLMGIGLGELAFCAPLKSFKCLAGGAIALWILFTGVESVKNLRVINRTIARDDALNLHLLDQTQAFVAQHAMDPGFSFLLDIDNSDPVVCPMNAGIPITAILFRKYEEPRPSWILTWKDAGLSTRYCGNNYPEMPFLHGSLGNWNIYNYSDEYWAVHRSSGPMKGKQEVSDKCLRASSVEDIRKKIREIGR